MLELWYAIAVFSLTAYVVLDGYDLGAGALHAWVARNDLERRQVFAAIGPYWDGNEVWLIFAGGTLMVAFPRVLAGGVSGFYFAIFLLLWCLILRGISIEFRSHVQSDLWRAAWDFSFVAASGLLSFFFGAALGNLLRGVPLDRDGWFELSLFTDFSARDPVGILDWYTVSVGIFALVALAAHGSVFLVWKTDGAVQARSRRAGRALCLALVAMWPAVTIATQQVNPDFLGSLATRPLAWALAALALAGLAAAILFLRGGRDLAAFLGSSAFLAGLSTATAAATFPVMLRARGSAAPSLTVFSGGSDPVGLRSGIVWFAIGFPLVVAYFAIVHRIHRGKVSAGPTSHGYGTPA